MLAPSDRLRAAFCLLRIRQIPRTSAFRILRSWAYPSTRKFAGVAGALRVGGLLLREARIDVIMGSRERRGRGRYEGRLRPFLHALIHPRSAWIYKQIPPGVLCKRRGTLYFAGGLSSIIGPRR